MNNSGLRACFATLMIFIIGICYLQATKKPALCKCCCCDDCQCVGECCPPGGIVQPVEK